MYIPHERIKINKKTGIYVPWIYKIDKTDIYVPWMDKY